MNKNYFKWLIKSRRISILFFLLISVAFQLISFTSFNHLHPEDTFISCANVGNVLSVLLSMAMPVLLFSFIHRKSSVDMFLSLPVSRKSQLLSNILLTWLLAYGSFFIGTTLVWVTQTFHVISVHTWAMLQLYEAFSLLVLILVNTAVFTFANSIFDGIVMIGAYMTLPGIVGISVMIFMECMVAGRNLPENSFIYSLSVMLSPLAMQAQNLEFILEPEYSELEIFNRLYVILQFLYGMLAILLLRHHFIKRKSERAGQISDDFLSYPFIINIYLALILLDMAWNIVSSGWDNMEFFYLLLFFIYIVASFVYKRTLKITWRPVAFFICAAVVSIGVAKVGWATEGFGLSRLPHELFRERYLCYSYDGYVSITDLGKATEDDDTDDARVDFTLEIPKEEKDRYGLLIEKMEEYRKQSRAHFYSKAGSNDNPNSLMFNVYNREDTSKSFEHFRFEYDGAYPLSEDDLREISKYCEVTVTPYLEKDNGWSSLEMTLSEFMKWRNTDYTPSSAGQN